MPGAVCFKGILWVIYKRVWCMASLVCCWLPLAKMSKLPSVCSNVAPTTNKCSKHDIGDIGLYDIGIYFILLSFFYQYDNLESWFCWGGHLHKKKKNSNTKIIQKQKCWRKKKIFGVSNPFRVGRKRKNWIFHTTVGLNFTRIRF